MAKEKKEKEKKEKKGKKEKEEKPKKAKKEKKGKKDKKEKGAKPKKEKKKKGKKGEPEEPEAPEEKGKKGKGKKSGKKAPKKEAKGEPKKETKKAPAPPAAKGGKGAAPAEGADLPEGMEGAQEPVEEKPLPWFNLSWGVLHLLGMGLMLCDDLWIIALPGSHWMACLGRMAYPIFAFLLVEGFYHTEDLWRYLLRLLGLAALSEIPFNLLYGGSIVYPAHQNVIWTYVIAMLLLILLDEFRERFGQTAMLLFLPVPAFLGYFLGEVLLTDYYGMGVLIILVFYVFHGRHWACFMGQLICLWLINLRLLGGYYYVMPFLGYDFELIQQGVALLSLALIWLYHGRQGLHGRVFRWFCYLFYPVHMLALIILRSKLLL